jgi:hypothetical protein
MNGAYTVSGTNVPAQRPRTCDALHEAVTLAESSLQPVLLGEKFTANGSFFHSFKCLLDSPAAGFWEAANAIGFLPPGLDLDAIPEPS